MEEKITGGKMRTEEDELEETKRNCPYCSCVFYYTKNDIVIRTNGSMKDKCVICPSCGKQLMP